MAVTPAPWRPPLGAVRRTVVGMSEYAELTRLLNERYASVTTAALVMAYVDGIVDFITTEAFVDHVEGHTPRKLAHELKVLRSQGDDPVAFLNSQVEARQLVVRPVGADLLAALPQPKALGAEFAAPSREAVLQQLEWDEDF